MSFNQAGSERHFKNLVVVYLRHLSANMKGSLCVYGPCLLLKSCVHIMNQFVRGTELEGIIGANFDNELPFNRAEQLNMSKRVPLGSGDHSRRVVEFGNLEHQLS